MKRAVRSPWTWVATALVAGVVIFLVVRGGPEPRTLRYDEYERAARAGEVRTARILERDHAVEGTLADGAAYRVSFPKDYTEPLTRLLRENDQIEITSDPQQSSMWTTVLTSVLPFLLIVGVIFVLLTRFQG